MSTRVAQSRPVMPRTLPMHTCCCTMTIVLGDALPAAFCLPTALPPVCLCPCHPTRSPNWACNVVGLDRYQPYIRWPSGMWASCMLLSIAITAMPLCRLAALPGGKVTMQMMAPDKTEVPAGAPPHSALALSSTLPRRLTGSST